MMIIVQDLLIQSVHPYQIFACSATTRYEIKQLLSGHVPTREAHHLPLRIKDRGEQYKTAREETAGDLYLCSCSQSREKIKIILHDLNMLTTTVSLFQ